MSKRKAVSLGLGLGDYGSDEEEEEEELEDGGGEQEAQAIDATDAAAGDSGLGMFGSLIEPGIGRTVGEAAAVLAIPIVVDGAPSVDEATQRQEGEASPSVQQGSDAVWGTPERKELPPGHAGRTPERGAAAQGPFAGLPPEMRDPLPQRCPPGMQAIFERHLGTMRKTGSSINEHLRSQKSYRNPDFLQKLVEHFKMDDVGSAFPKDVFDPHALPKEDFKDALVQQLKVQQEQKQLAREQAKAHGLVPNIPFISAGAIPGSGSSLPVTVSAQGPQGAAYLKAQQIANQLTGGLGGAGVGGQPLRKSKFGEELSGTAVRKSKFG